MSMQFKERGFAPAPSESLVQRLLEQEKVVDVLGVRTRTDALSADQIKTSVEAIKSLTGTIRDTLVENQKKFPESVRSQVEKLNDELLIQNLARAGLIDPDQMNDYLNNPDQSALAEKREDLVNLIVSNSERLLQEQLRQIDESLGKIPAAIGILQGVHKRVEDEPLSPMHMDSALTRTANEAAEHALQVLKAVQDNKDYLQEPAHEQCAVNILRTANQLAIDIIRKAVVRQKLEDVQGAVDETMGLADIRAEKEPYPKVIKESFKKTKPQSVELPIDAGAVIERLRNYGAKLEKDSPDEQAMSVLIDRLRTMNDYASNLEKGLVKDLDGISNDVNNKRVPDALEAVDQLNTLRVNETGELRSESVRAIYSLGLRIAELCRNSKLHDKMQELAQQAGLNLDRLPELSIPSLAQEQIDTILTSICDNVLVDQLSPEKKVVTKELEALQVNVELRSRLKEILEPYKDTLGLDLEEATSQIIEHQSKKIVNAFFEKAVPQLASIQSAEEIAREKLEPIAEELAKYSKPFDKVDNAYEDLRAFLAEEGIIIPSQKDEMLEQAKKIEDGIAQLKGIDSNDPNAYAGVIQLIQQKLERMRSQLDQSDPKKRIENEYKLQGHGLELKSSLLEAAVLNTAKDVAELRKELSEVREKCEKEKEELKQRYDQQLEELKDAQEQQVFVNGRSAEYPSDRKNAKEVGLKISGYEIKQYSKVIMDTDLKEADCKIYLSIRSKSGRGTIDIELGSARNFTEYQETKNKIDKLLYGMRSLGADLIDGSKLNIEGESWKRIRELGLRVGRLENLSIIGTGNPQKGKYGSADLGGLDLSGAEIAGTVTISNCYGVGVNMDRVKVLAGASLNMTKNRFGYLSARGMDLTESKDSKINNNDFLHSTFEGTKLGSALFQKNLALNSNLKFCAVDTDSFKAWNAKNKGSHFSGRLGFGGQFKGTTYTPGSFNGGDRASASPAQNAAEDNGKDDTLSGARFETAVKGLNNGDFMKSLKSTFGLDGSNLDGQITNPERSDICFVSQDGRTRLVVSRNPDDNSRDIVLKMQGKDSAGAWKDDELLGGLISQVGMAQAEALKKKDVDKYSELVAELLTSAPAIFKRPVNPSTLNTQYVEVQPANYGDGLNFSVAMSALQAEHAIQLFKNGQLGDRREAAHKFAVKVSERLNQIKAEEEAKKTADADKAARRAARDAAKKAGGTAADSGSGPTAPVI